MEASVFLFLELGVPEIEKILLLSAARWTVLFVRRAFFPVSLTLSLARTVVALTLSHTCFPLRLLLLLALGSWYSCSSSQVHTPPLTFPFAGASYFSSFLRFLLMPAVHTRFFFVGRDFCHPAPSARGETSGQNFSQLTRHRELRTPFAAAHGGTFGPLSTTVHTQFSPPPRCFCCVNPQCPWAPGCCRDCC